MTVCGCLLPWFGIDSFERRQAVPRQLQLLSSLACELTKGHCEGERSEVGACGGERSLQVDATTLLAGKLQLNLARRAQWSRRQQRKKGRQGAALGQMERQIVQAAACSQRGHQLSIDGLQATVELAQSFQLRQLQQRRLSQAATLDADMLEGGTCGQWRHVQLAHIEFELQSREARAMLQRREGGVRAARMEQTQVDVGEGWSQTQHAQIGYNAAAESESVQLREWGKEGAGRGFVQAEAGE